MTVRVAVVGGGLSGLLTATALAHVGVDEVIVLEGSPRPGGVAGTIRRDGYLVERAASTLRLPHPHLSPLLEVLGLDPLPVDPTASGRLVYTGGRLLDIPMSPRLVTSPIVGPVAKLRALVEPLRGRGAGGDESLDAFLRRRFGDGAGRMIGWLMAGGVFAGDPEQLSAAAAFPMLTGLEAEAGSVVRGGLRRRRAARGMTPPSAHVLAGGMEEITGAARRFLGDRLRLGAPVESVTPAPGGWRIVTGADAIDADHVVLAVTPDHAARLIGGELTDVLAGSVACPVVVVGLGGPADAMGLPGAFGALNGPDAGLGVRGVLFESSQAPGRAPEGHSLARVIAGGAVRPEMVGWDDETLAATVVAETSVILGRDLSPSFVEIARHTGGIPQYPVGHTARLDTADRLLAERPGLHLTGWGYRGVGISALATDAIRLSRLVSGA